MMEYFNVGILIFWDCEVLGSCNLASTNTVHWLAGCVLKISMKTHCGGKL